MLREQFLSDEKNRTRAFEAAWDKVTNYEDIQENAHKNDASVPEFCIDDDHSKEEYVKMLSAFGLKSKQTFFHYKSAIKSYLDYLETNGAISKQSVDYFASILFGDLKYVSSLKDADVNNIRISYYKDIEMLTNAIDITLDSSDAFDINLHDRSICAIYLAWYGLSKEEIIEFKKEDVGDSCLYIGGDIVFPPQYAQDIFLRCRDSEGYLVGGRWASRPYTYVESPYLIRSDREVKASAGGLSNLFERFNKIRNGRYSLNYSTVYQSGAFCRAYMMEQASKASGYKFDLRDIAFASKVLGEKINTADRHRKILKEYKAFKTMFDVDDN